MWPEPGLQFAASSALTTLRLLVRWGISLLGVILNVPSLQTLKALEENRKAGGALGPSEL